MGLNKMHYGLKVVAVKAPGFGESKTSILQDIAIQTGAQMLSKEVGLNLDNVDISHLGTAKSVEVTKDTTTIMEGAGDEEAIDSRKKQLRDLVETEKSTYQQGKLRERLAKLSGGVAVIHCG